MEAKLLFLEKPRIKYYPLPIHFWCFNHIWHCFLANRFNNVSIHVSLPVSSIDIISRKFAISSNKHILAFRCNSKEEQDVLNILGIAYTSALFLGFVNCCTLQPIVVMERVVLYRERASGMYSSMAYVIAQVRKWCSSLVLKVNDL